MPAGITSEVNKDVKTYQLFINGEWVESRSNKTFPVYDPASEEVIAQVPDANAEDVNNHYSPGTRACALSSGRENSSEPHDARGT
jgi:hypothetical protein